MKLTASTDAMQICGMLETFICRDITTIRSDAQLENIRPYRGVLGNNSDRDNTNQAGVRFRQRTMTPCDLGIGFKIAQRR